MDLIPSFQIDHTHLEPGIYISRQDAVGDQVVTTYDIRLTAPNREPAVGQGAMHTLEHLVATYLRNEPTWKDEVIYWGPMGCLTGSYLVMKGARSPKEIAPLIRAAFQFVVDFEGKVPGTTPETCGNYLLHDLPMARWEARRFIERMLQNPHYEYPISK